MDQQKDKPADESSPPAAVPVEPEYETSPDAPYNRHSVRHLGSHANECSDANAEIERTKQYYHGEKPA